MTVTTTTAPLRASRARRRVSLRVKALLIAVLPVLVLGLLTALILTVQRRAALDAISRNLSGSVAGLLASTLDVQDLNLVDTQLRAAVASPSVAFIDVQPAGQELRFFISDEPDSDWYLRALLDDFRREQPGGTHLRLTDRRADAYRAALAALEPGTPASVRQHLEDRLSALERVQGQTQAIELTQLDVYETPAGRALRPPGTPPPSGTLLFRLDIGVTLNDLGGVLDRQLYLVLLAGAVVALLAALAAYRAVRGLVRVILAITDAAHHASLGRLNEPLDARQLGSNDELHDLVTALERLRVSLHLALSRLLPGGKGP